MTDLPRRTVDYLKEARSLIALPENWTQHTARSVRDDGVVSYCAVGALWYAVGGFRNGTIGGSVTKSDEAIFFEMSDLLHKEIGGPAASFNDKHTHAEVLDVFDRAILRADSD